MLYFLHIFSDGGDIFNLFRYITFRAGGAFFTALCFGFILGKPLINFLRKKQKSGQPIRSDGPEHHLILKAGTPTMGGVLILGAMLVGSILWARPDNIYVWVILLVTVGFGSIGFVDDYKKVIYHNSKGLSKTIRLFLGLLISFFASLLIMGAHSNSLAGFIAFPVFKGALFDLGLFFIPFAILVIVGSANAVNLTDGLDGLAVMPVMIASGALGIIA